MGRWVSLRDRKARHLGDRVAWWRRGRLAVWPHGAPETPAWDLQLVERDGPATGSIILIAHHSDVQFGNVSVRSVG